MKATTPTAGNEEGRHELVHAHALEPAQTSEQREAHARGQDEHRVHVTDPPDGEHEECPQDEPRGPARMRNRAHDCFGVNFVDPARSAAAALISSFLARPDTSEQSKDSAKGSYWYV